MSNRCWLFHDWGKWEIIKVNVISAVDPKIKWNEDKQRRVCKKCGLTQVRRLEIS